MRSASSSQRACSESLLARRLDGAIATRPIAWGCLGAEAACPSLLPRRRKMTLMRIATAVALAVWTSAIAIAQPLVVGAKDFTEQLLISEMTTQLLRANGFAVYTGSGFTTAGVRSALEAGVVDLYWEYTGTSLSASHGVREKLPPNEAYARVKQLDAEKGLVWLWPSKVNNTYALAMRRTDAEKWVVESISDLAAKVRQGERFTLATNGEFLVRPDG